MAAVSQARVSLARLARSSRRVSTHRAANVLRATLRIRLEAQSAGSAVLESTKGLPGRKSVTSAPLAQRATCMPKLRVRCALRVPSVGTRAALSVRCALWVRTAVPTAASPSPPHAHHRQRSCLRDNFITRTGTFTSCTNSHECTPCPMGTYSNVTGLAQCIACPPGTCVAFRTPGAVEPLRNHRLVTDTFAC